MRTAVPERADDLRTELTLSVPAAGRPRVLAALGAHPLDAEVRQVAFVDRPDLPLLRRGLLVQLERTRRRGTSVVVTRRVDGPVPGAASASVRVAGHVADRDALRLLSGSGVLADLLTAGQRALVEETLPDRAGLEGLVALGPVHVLRRTYVAPRCRPPLTARLWFIPARGLAMDLIATCPASQAARVTGEVTRFLDRVGVSGRGDGTPPAELAAALAARAAHAAHAAHAGPGVPGGGGGGGR